ncbi:MAG: sugar phosphate nucleotidyltransferase [Candidatus Omnitrophica bacterium]|nr:sugar phosphate nucleotidyltransferase [Candidatus Omnitrophota bacterium]
MKGVILAGGLGTRLYPLTKITNKHLLPVFDKPMIYYPLATLIDAGIKDVLIVTGGNHAGEFLRLLGNGKELNLKEIHYTYQSREKGIADALRLAEDFADGEKMIVVLGDNLFGESIKPYVAKFSKQREGAKILLKKINNPQRFGVADFKNGKVLSIEEKPKKPKSNYAVTGLYMYDSKIFDYIRELKISNRGEYEITDINNMYLKEGKLTCDILKGYWTDCGTCEALFRANVLIAKNQGVNFEDLL